jgi:Domain of unknown function (DUF4340)
MKLQKTSVGLVAIALLLGGWVYMTSQGEPQRDAQKVQADRLFNFQEADVQGLTVKTLTKSLAFERSAGASPAWKMTVPKAGPANAGAIAFLLNLLATGKSQTSLKVPVARLPEFELDRPFATIEVKLKDQRTYRMTLGKANFNNTGIYAQVNPPELPTPELTVSLVPLDFQNAVTRPEAEWQTADPETTPKFPTSPSPN